MTNWVVWAALLLAPVLAAQKAQQPTSRPAEKAEPKRTGGYLGLYLTERPLGRRRTLVKIESVFRGSDAEKLGFRAGDVVMSVNGRRVRNGDGFIQQLWRTAPILRGGRRGENRTGRGGGDEVVVLRNGKELTIAAGMAELDANPKVGSLAPDFTLKTPDGKSERTLRKLHAERPLVLIFGSYT